MRSRNVGRGGGKYPGCRREGEIGLSLPGEIVIPDPGRRGSILETMWEFYGTEGVGNGSVRAYPARPLQSHFANAAIRMRLIVSISQRPASNVRASEMTCRRSSRYIIECSPIRRLTILYEYTVEKQGLSQPRNGLGCPASASGNILSVICLEQNVRHFENHPC